MSIENFELPIYSCQVLTDSKKLHLSVGIEKETLCGKKDIFESSIIPYSKPIHRFISENSEKMCDDCVQKWDKVKDKFLQEETVKCNRCSEYTSIYDSSTVMYIGKNVYLCPACHNRLYHSQNSNVENRYRESRTETKNKELRKLKNLNL